VISPSWWYRHPAEIRAAARHSVGTPIVARDPGDVIDVSGVRRLASRQHQTEIVTTTASKTRSALWS